MARRSQCSDAGDNPLDPNYLPPHYREEYRLAIDALIEDNVDGYYKFLQFVDVVDFLSPSEIDYIQNSIQLPNQNSHTEQRYLDTGGDGSSDTYWPLHSDLDAPGLDLGWPQIHHFIGPTEVTTLVNPAAPDMPSIKEQARRLIKNAQMVIAVVMDMFTDVDIFADIINAAMRNVAVYLLLDEANVDCFINMVNNCRVNLQNIPYLRVRTVSGIRYHCRTGKSFKGQMLDRFILTDCRAVLSGNYSFMWSYEKLHRCMAHLFLGQLVSTFDEEFRILFAQSEPLVIENMEDMTVLSKRPLPGERPMLGDTRKYRTMDTGGHQEKWNRPPYEENMDWRTMQLKRQETFHGPLDIYNRYPSPQSRQDPQNRLEPQFDQLHPRLMDSLANKRHSFAEGVGPGRYNLPYQQGLPEAEQPGRPYYRGQQHLHPRDEPDYGGYGGQMDKFWNQEEPYAEPGYPRDTELPHEGYDPVLNYLSSARNVDVDQSSDKLIPGPDLPYSTTHPRRHKGQAYACQTSPTPSGTTEKKFMQEHSSDRKDPTVKRGLRNWRISSYLSTYDSAGEPEGLPMGPGQTIDPFDDMPDPMQEPTPPPGAIEEQRGPKIPNVREFKVPALPRASQMPAYAKTTPRDVPKGFPDEIPQATLPLIVVPEPKVITPTPSESSSTTDGEKQEEPDFREPITSTLRREDSFRRKYNAPAVQRSSRLRSSLIFSSLDQNTNQDNTEPDDDKTKAETEQTKLPFSQVLAQRRSGAREPFEWRNYIKSTDNAKMEEDSSKQVEKDSESKLESQKESEDVRKSKDVSKIQEAAKAPELVPKVEQPKFEPQPPPQIQPPTKSLLNEPFVDMNDPDQRFLFFKHLAAQRKAEEAKLKQKPTAKDKNDGKKEDKTQKDVAVTSSNKQTEDSKKIDGKTLDLSGKIDKVGKVDDKKLPTTSQSSEKLETKVATADKKDEVNKEERTQKDRVSTTTDKPKEDRKKTDTKTLDLVSKTATIEAMQSSQKISPTFSTDLGKTEANQSKVSQPALIDSKQTSLETASSKSAQKQDKPTQANVAGTLTNVEKFTEETQSATTTDATSNDPQLKTSRSVPDFAKTSVSDLMSSLPSSRIYERSLSLEANKDTTPKPRLWSPSLHRRDLLKAFGEKSKSISTVQIEEEASRTAADVAPSKSQEISSVKSQISDKTGTKQNKDLKVETTASVTESRDTEIIKDGKEASPSQSVSPVDSSKKSSPLPTIPEALSNIPTKTIPQSEKSSQNVQSLVKSSGTEVTGSSEKPSLSQSIGSKAKPTQDQPKTDKVQSLIPTEQKTCSDEQVADKGILKKACPEIVASTTDKPSGETTGIGKDAGETRQLGSIDKTSIATQEMVELVSDSSPNSKDSKMPSSDKTEEGPVAFPKVLVSAEDFTSLESHSNTSSPASFATALEFISSEDSDMLSPARADPQHLFKSVNTESSMSDMSDFETPNSDLSMSPMPFADDSVDDSVSIAETVIQAGSRRKSEITEERKVEGGAPSETQESQKGLSKVEPPQDSLCPEKGTENLDVAAKTIEAGKVEEKTDSMGASQQVEQGIKDKSSTESISTNVKAQNLASQSQTNSKLSEQKTVCPTDPTTSGETKDAKMSITAEITTKDGSKSTETGKESTDVRRIDGKVSGDAEIKPKEVKSVDKESNIGSKAPTKTRIVSSRFLSEPKASVKTPATEVTPNVTKEEEKADTVSEQMSKEAIEEKGKNLEASKSEIATPQAKTSDEITELKTKDVSALTENVVSPKDDKCETRTEVSSNTDPAKQTQEAKISDTANELTTIDTKDSQEDASKEVSSSTTQASQSTVSVATSEDPKVLHKESKEISTDDQSKDNNVNTKDVDQAKQSETAPPTAQPKQQSKTAQSRYLSSTANVISSSNLRDDTKILLEQISAQSQSRNESTAAKEAPVTDDEKEDEADKNAKRKNELRSSLGQPKTSQERDKVLERIQTMRKDRKVYSRFEL